MLICYSDPNYIYFIAFVDHENRMIDTVSGILTLVAEILLETGFSVMAA